MPRTNRDTLKRILWAPGSMPNQKHFYELIDFSIESMFPTTRSIKIRN